MPNPKQTLLKIFTEMLTVPFSINEAYFLPIPILYANFSRLNPFSVRNFFILFDIFSKNKSSFIQNLLGNKCRETIKLIHCKIVRRHILQGISISYVRGLKGIKS